MAVIQWHDGLNVGMRFMDADHAEAAEMINALAQCRGAERVTALERFIAHCRDHFACEEAMMEKTGFFALHCHQGEHTRVLAEWEGVLERLRGGDAQDGYFTDQLPQWLLNHRNTMDFVTAEFARNAGFSG